MKTVIVVQARMSSERLPGKVLREILGKPLLEFEIERLKRVRGVAHIVVATTNRAGDAGVKELCERLQVECFRGDEFDVLDRCYRAVSPFAPDLVVRVTGDCPLIDPEIVEQLIAIASRAENPPAYASNVGTRTYPRGMDAEVLTFAALSAAVREATLPDEREHVTPFIRTRPERFSAENLSYHCDCSRHRWTVDTPEDFELIKAMLEEVYPVNQNFTVSDLLAACERHPEWESMNSHIEQKKWDRSNKFT